MRNHREAEKEKGLLEKRLQRLEEARAAESAQLGAELQKQREAVASELNAKDNKINDLVEELGGTQALLTEKEAALAEVRSGLPATMPSLSPCSARPWQSTFNQASLRSVKRAGARRQRKCVLASSAGRLSFLTVQTC